MTPLIRPLIALALASGALALSAGMSPAGALTAMQSGCTFTMDLSRELGLLSQAATPVTASARDHNAPVAGRDLGLAVTLVKQGSVTFAQPPQSRRGTADSYAGLISLGNLPKGEWRVSANKAVWFDLVSNNRLLESPTFEMQAGCAGLRKSVVFVQPADAIALLQINGGTDADVRIVITPHTPAR